MRKKYTPKTKEKLNAENYKELLKIERGDEYTFLEDYIKSTEPILCRHNPCGHEWKVAPYEIIKRGSSCPNCVFKKGHEKEKSSLEDLKKLLNENYGYDPYTFLGEYINNSTKIQVRCNSCNSEFGLTPGNIKNNIRLKRKPMCKTCNAKRMKENTKGSEEYLSELKELFGEVPYELLEPYINSDTKILHKCLVCKHEFKATPQNILYTKKKYNRRYCPKCNNMIRDERDYEERLRKSNPNIIALEKYKGLRKKILHKCLVCKNIWLSAPKNRLQGEGCPKCANKITQSAAELAVNQFLNDNGIPTIQRDRKILEGKEIDILIPDKKIAIEVDGTYWHNEKYKGKNYHLDKTNKCKEKGYQLIHIFDDEWDNKTEIVKSKLLHLLGEDDNPRIYARKCYIKEIDAKTCSSFLNKNHIQGSDNSKIKLGLFTFENNQLVTVMTFCKPRISLGNKNSNYTYELSRFASDINYLVIGGFGKLFKYFINNYDFNSIITYADKRYSLGNLYYKNGFKLIRESQPNYFYIDINTRKRYHRYSFRKQVLKDKFPEFYDPNKTEFQIMDETKAYKRVYDCGNLVFEYRKEN